MNNKVLILLGAILLLILFYWIIKKSRKNKCSQKCKTPCLINEDDYKKVKDIQLTKCQTCENYCENSKSSGCCSNCQQGLINLKENHQHDCLQGHFHHHHHHKHNCHSDFKHSNIQLIWVFWLIPLIIGIVSYSLIKKFK